MGQPTAYNRQSDATDYATANPDATFNAADLDAELDAIETSLDAILTNLALLQSDTGGLTNGLVTPQALSTATKTLIAANWTPRGIWATGSAYTIGDLVDNTASGVTTSYVCAVAHTAGTLSTDVTAGKWNTLGATVAGSASSITFSATGTIAATDVQAAIAEVAVEALQVGNNLSDVGAAATAASNLSVPTYAQIQKQTHFVAAAGGTANALTASFSPAITALVDKMRVVVVAASANTTTTPTFTPNSGTVDAKTIVKGANAALIAGDIPGQYAVCVLQYNSTLDKWLLVNPAASAGSLSSAGGTLTGSLTMSAAAIIEAEGAAVASDTTCNIWAGDGGTVHVTGAVEIESFGTAPQAGAWMRVIFDGAPNLVQSANLNLNGGGGNLQIEAGDVAFVYADTTTQADVFVVSQNYAKLNKADQTLTGGVIPSSESLGTIASGTVTPNPGAGPQQHYTNGGAHTLAPSANAGSILVDITNNASAGAITTSGFTKVMGDAFATTDTYKYRCHISIGNAGSLLQVQAMQ